MARDIQIDLKDMLKRTPYAGKDVVVGVALSGGRDSVALAYALKKSGANLVAINVEHGIRGESSVADSVFAEEFCKEYGIPFLGYSVDAPTFSKQNGYTLEQGARILRYEIFDRALNEKKCDLIALAHHLDDQVETVFMRILRGTGLNGLCGMKEVNGRYIRPLLSYTREEIDAYIKENSLAFVDDESNDDVAYTRNFLRREIAVLKERFPNLCQSVARLCKNACEDNECINLLVPDIRVADGEAAVGIAELENCHIAEKKRLIMKAVNALGVYQDIEDRHYKDIFDLAFGENGKYICLTHGITVHKDNDGEIVFVRDIKDKITAAPRPFALGENSDFGVFAQIVSRDVFEKERKSERQKGALYFDLDKLPKDAVIRFRREGDSILKFGGGRKNLGDFLTDKKIPLRKRDKTAVVASGGEIYAVAGVEISALVKVDADTRNIVKFAPL